MEDGGWKRESLAEHFGRSVHAALRRCAQTFPTVSRFYGVTSSPAYSPATTIQGLRARFVVSPGYKPDKV